MSMQYFVHFNLDFNESLTYHATVREAYESIAEAMAIDLPVSDPAFGDAVMFTYEYGNWKGLAIYRFDPDSGQVTTVTETDLKAEIEAETGEPTPHRPMSNQQYLDAGTVLCPFCRSRQISTGAFDVDVGVARRDLFGLRRGMARPVSPEGLRTHGLFLAR